MKKFEEEVKRPTSNITQDSIKPKLSSAIEFYTQKQKDAYNAIRERDEYINFLESKLNESRDLECDANNQAAHEYILKCEAEEDRAELKRENAELKSQLEKQQPEIPEFVAEGIKSIPDHYTAFGAMLLVKEKIEITKGGDINSDWLPLYNWLFSNNEINSQDLFSQAWINGYTVAKEKRYEVVFLEDDTTRQILMENHAGHHFIEEEDENYGYWKQDFTEKEIKAVNEKFWHLSVPVKNEQIEV